MVATVWKFEEQTLIWAPKMRKISHVSNLSSCRWIFLFTAPGKIFVVGSLGSQASMKYPNKFVGDGSQSLIV